MPVTATTPFDIEIDASATRGNFRSLQGVNLSPLGIPAWEWSDLTQNYHDIGVDYVRPHDNYNGANDVSHIFPHDLRTADVHNPANYNFAESDEQLLAARNSGAEIMFRVGESFGSSVNRISPDLDNQWAEVVRHIVLHYNNGWAPNSKYPQGFYWNIKYWEIWNEPDISQFWTGTAEEYYSLYNSAAKAIKRNDAEYNGSGLKVGGPAQANSDNQRFLEGFLSYCQKNRVPLDFYSWHNYSTAPYDSYHQADWIQKFLDKYGFSSVELLLTEWNYTPIAPKNEFWNARGAAWTAAVLASLQDTRVTVSNRYRGIGGDYWDPVSQSLIRGQGFGLFYNDGSYKKPAFAYLAFKKLLETPIRLAASGSDVNGYNVLAGKSSDNRSVNILINDFQSDRTGYNLNVTHLPWGSGQTINYTRYLINDLNNFRLIETQTINTSTDSFYTTEVMPKESIQFIRLEVITPPNQPPVLSSIGNKEINEGSNLTFSVSATDPNNDPLTLAARDLPSGARFTDNGNASGIFSWTPTYNQAGLYSVTFTADDGRGGTDSETITINVRNVDIEPPILSDIRTSNLTYNSATIVWTTDEPATSKIEYGLTANYGSAVENNNLVTSHSLQLTGLQYLTTYHYRVRSKDAVNNEAVSSDHTFTTTAPTVSCQLTPNAGYVYRGDSITSLAKVTNNSNLNLAIDAWVDDKRPDNSQHPNNPIAGPNRVTLAPGETKTVNFVITVPVNEQLGRHTQTLKVGQRLPLTIYASNETTVEVRQEIPPTKQGKK